MRGPHRGLDDKKYQKTRWVTKMVLRTETGNSTLRKKQCRIQRTLFSSNVTVDSFKESDESQVSFNPRVSGKTLKWLESDKLKSNYFEKSMLSEFLKDLENMQTKVNLHKRLLICVSTKVLQREKERDIVTVKPTQSDDILWRYDSRVVYQLVLKFKQIRRSKVK